MDNEPKEGTMKTGAALYEPASVEELQVAADHLCSGSIDPAVLQRSLLSWLNRFLAPHGLEVSIEIYEKPKKVKYRKRPPLD